jgi:4-aminobutyrate aminotransferase-like enzyme
MKPSITDCVITTNMRGREVTTFMHENQDLASAVWEAEERYVNANSQSAQLLDHAARAMPGGNKRTTIQFSPFPLCMAKGEGGRLIDLDGHVYADFVNEYTAGVFGHSNPIILGAPPRRTASCSAPRTNTRRCWRLR